MEIEVMINAKKSFTKMEKKDGLVMDIGSMKKIFQTIISICMLISLLMDKKNMLLCRQEIKKDIVTLIV